MHRQQMYHDYLFQSKLSIFIPLYEFSFKSYVVCASSFKFIVKVKEMTDVTVCYRNAKQIYCRQKLCRQKCCRQKKNLKYLEPSERTGLKGSVSCERITPSEAATFYSEGLQFAFLFVNNIFFQNN